MYFFLVAFGLLLHAFFWGAGLAVLLMPHPWKRFWPVLAAPAGLVLQSLVVWAGAYANLPGTNRYAWWSEAVPVAIAIWALLRRHPLLLWRDLSKLAGLWAIMAFCLTALVVPLARASRGLTTMSLGSCDAADYAAGARVLMEFARSDRSGFIGLTEVVQVMSVDNFFDFWLRLNHFTPSALIALNGTIFDCQPYELTSLMTVIFLVVSLPVVFWIARAAMAYSGAMSLWITLLYGLSPITWYAVFHVAMGQLLAAQAIALITWAGMALWRGDLSWRRGYAMAGVLAVGYGMLLGAYNFILIVCLVPAVTWVGGIALWKGEWRRFARWLAWMLIPLVGCGIIFAERVAGLAERFRLFQTYDFGWAIPALSPEGWLGLVATTDLNGFSGPTRVVLLGLVVVGTLGALVWGMKRQRREVYIALCLSVPVLIGYGYLQLRGARLGTNASYDAYKLLSVFFPGILAAVCYWVTLASSRALAVRVATYGALAAVTAFAFRTTYRFAERVETPPLMVGRELLQLRTIENMADVASVNVRVPDVWSRLWANALLLRKPQYFYWHTYEGRKDTPLRGEWDINGGLTQIQLPGAATRRIDAQSQFSLVDTRSPYFMRARIIANDGWYELERQSRATQRWRWTAAVARIHLENPQDHPLRVTCRFTNIHSLVDRDFQVWIGDRHLRTVRIKKELGSLRVRFVVPPGASNFEVRTSEPLTSPGGGDNRLLGFRIFGVDFEVLDDPALMKEEVADDL
jgi:hypothetical protein